jgi:hypothetical protein
MRINRHAVEDSKFSFDEVGQRQGQPEAPGFDGHLKAITE